MAPSSPLLNALREVYDLEELAEEASPMAALDLGPPGDPSFVIRWTNAAWDRFALDNGADRAPAVGDAYLDGIAEPLKSFYRSAFLNAVRTREIFVQRYECSSPTRHRQYHMRAIPLDDYGLLIEHSLVLERSHDRIPAEALEERYRMADGLVLQCSNCRRVHRPGGGWDWVPSWVAEMPAGTSHGLCAPCAGLYYHRAARRARP